MTQEPKSDFQRHLAARLQRLGNSAGPDPLAERLVTVRRDLSNWASRSVHVPFDPSGSHLVSVLELRLAYVKRCKDLASAIERLLESDQVVPATVLGRALIESTAMGCFYLHDMSTLIEAGNIDAFNDRFVRYYAGSSKKGSEIGSIRVRHAVAHLEKLDREYFTYLMTKYRAFSKLPLPGGFANEAVLIDKLYDNMSVRKNYAALCDIAHPNGTGTQAVYPETSVPGKELHDGVIKDCAYQSLMAIWQCHFLITELEDTEDLAVRFKAAFLSD